MNILLVEDDPQISRFTLRELRALGFTVDHSEDGDDAYVQASRNEYDAIVLDIMLPGRDGIQVLEQLRADGAATPVILLTARNELDDRVAGLQAGADDYLAKPFYIEELVARLEALVRRSRGTSGDLLRHGELAVDVMRRAVSNAGRTVHLTTREFDLLAYLMRSPGRVRSRAQIRDHVWDGQYDPSSNVVDVCVRRLRTKLTESGEPDPFVAVRGVGYHMAPVGDT